MKANQAYLQLLDTVVSEGKQVTCRGHETVELLHCTSVIDMCQPLVTLKRRKMGYRFACAEAASILSGDNRVASLAPYSKQIANFSDDGVFFFGAYGPKIIDQLEYVGRAFKADLYTRQAIINIWREKPPVSKDIPCTLNMQFIIRENDEGKKQLHTFVNMRSSDIWLGVPYDWFTFSMVSAYVAVYIREMLKIELDLGYLSLTAGSQHFYANSFGYKMEDVLETINQNTEEVLITDFEYSSLDINEFYKPHDIVDLLWHLASHKTCLSEINFLTELAVHWGDLK